jgi:lactate permease
MPSYKKKETSMNIFIVLLALLPIIVIFLLLTLRRTAADVAGTIGWIAAVVVAWLYFDTSLPVVLTASLCGVVASFPIALVVAASILQVTIMLETGAIARVGCFLYVL